MMKPKITRRDFLKLFGAGSAAWALGSNLSRWVDEPINVPHPEYARSFSTNPPNILVIIFDAWSATNMSLFGYARQTTPMLEKLAQRAVVYHHHYAAGNFTTPGTASLLTGVYPWSHRALQLRSQVLDQYTDHSIFHSLPKNYHRFAYTHNINVFVLLHQFRKSIDHLFKPSHLSLINNSLADTLFYENYFPAIQTEELFIRSEATPPISLFLSLLDHLRLRKRYQQLLEKYQADYPRGLIKWGADDNAVFAYRLEDAIDWLNEQALSAPQPYFGYVHLFPPHAPYSPRVEFTRLFEDNLQPPEKPAFLTARQIDPHYIQSRRWEYDQNIAYVDAEFARLYQTLQDNGSLKNTILVLTSDHGEMFERNLYGHTTAALYEPVIHIPLLIFFPEQHSRVDIYTPTSAVDLMPTLVQLAGGSLPASCEGFPLPFSPIPTPSFRDVYVVEAKENQRHAPFTKASFASIRWPYKLTYYNGYERNINGYELYNLEDDPEEMINLHSQDQAIANSMWQTLLDSVPVSPSNQPGLK